MIELVKFTHKELVEIAYKWVLKNCSVGVAFKEPAPAKLEVRKLTKKDLKKYEKRFEQLRREEDARRQIDWESLNRPMTI